MSGIGDSKAVEMGYVAEKIEELQRQGDVYTKKIEIEKRRHDDIVDKVMKYRDLLQETKKNMGGVNASNEEFAATQKSIRILENRLEKFLTKYNETRNANKKIRDQIQNLRREKVQQHQIREKLDRDLHLKAQQLQVSAKHTQAAYDARDRVLRQIETTKQQAQDRIAAFEIQWNEKKEELEMDQMLLKEQNPKTKTKTDEQLKSGIVKSLRKETAMKHDTSKAHWSLAKKEVDLKRQRDRLSHFEGALERIWTETGVDNVQDIVSGFLAAEEQNFSLFNMINQLNTETEEMEVEMHKLNQQIADAKGDDQLSDLNRQKIKANLEEQIKSSQEKSRAHELQYTERMAVIDSMKNGIMSIFHKVGCNDEALGQQLASTGVTDINIMNFLGIIEQRIGEIVQMHMLSTQKKEDGDKAARKAPKRNPRGVPSLHPLPPTTDEFAESDTEENDEHVKPYSLSELQEKTSTAIAKRKDTRRMKRPTVVQQL